MISKVSPVDWQGLQVMVAQLLEECGLKVEVEKKIKTVRGEVAIDVFAEEQIFGRPYIVLCECKFWKSRVHQSVVHGFRAVMSDVGANCGYIVSLSGFQRGSFEASENTNIKLMTWSEFQDEYEDTWIRRYFLPTLSEGLDSLFTYTDPLRLEPKWFKFLTSDERELFNKYYDKYSDFGGYMLYYSKWLQMFEFEKSHLELPLLKKFQSSNVDVDDLDIPVDILHESAYREFLEKVLAYGSKAISEFHAIRDAGMSRAEA